MLSTFLLMADAILTQGEYPPEHRILSAAAAIAAGEVVQLPDGRAGVYAGQNAAAAGDPATLYTRGRFAFAKTASIVLLKGGKAYWDRSANAVHFRPVQADGDFYLGTIAADAASTDTTVDVDLNEKQNLVIEWGKGIWDSVTVLTAGTVIPNTTTGVCGTDPGGSNTKFTFSATAEAQKVDALSRAAVPIGIKGVFEARVAIYNIGDNAALDINIGLANGTHATDADSITESVFIHLDGNSLNINAESDDGTTEVAATDTTVDAVDDTYFEIWIDFRDNTDIQIYIDGVNVLPSSVFKLNAATGPMKALVHLEKTSDDTVADVRVESIGVRTFEC